MKDETPLKLVVPGEFPGMNEIVDARRITKGKWNAYTDLKRQYDAKVVLFAQMAKFPKVTSPKHFVYHIFAADRRRDPSNILMGAAKFIEDGLQEAELLDNDGWGQVLSIRGRFYVDAVKPRVELYLFENEEGK